MDHISLKPTTVIALLFLCIAALELELMIKSELRFVPKSSTIISTTIPEQNE